MILFWVLIGVLIGAGGFCGFLFLMDGTDAFHRDHRLNMKTTMSGPDWSADISTTMHAGQLEQWKKLLSQSIETGGVVILTGKEHGLSVETLKPGHDIEADDEPVDDKAINWVRWFERQPENIREAIAYTVQQRAEQAKDAISVKASLDIAQARLEKMHEDMDGMRRQTRHLIDKFEASNVVHFPPGRHSSRPKPFPQKPPADIEQDVNDNREQYGLDRHKNL